jgi:Tfp pilus assembly protein PilP
MQTLCSIPKVHAEEGTAIPRNPFQSLIEKPEDGRELLVPDVEEGRFSPLQEVQEIKQLKVIGIIQGELGNYGIVYAPDGKMYMVTIGTLVGIFKGQVTAITDNAVVITETKQYQSGDKIETQEEETSLYLIPLEKTEETAPVQGKEKPVPKQKPANTKKRREPFKSLIEKPEVARELLIPAVDEDALLPLQKIQEIKQLKVVGILQGELGYFGIVEAPDGKTYMVTAGTRVGIFKGKVTAITDNAVVITETKEYQTGDTIETKEEETSLKLKPLEKGD